MEDYRIKAKGRILKIDLPERFENTIVKVTVIKIAGNGSK